jgi:signal transduction histidine kinase
MNSLRLDAQLLRKEALKEKQADSARIAELAERMQGTVDRTDGVLTEFLYLSSPESEAEENYDVIDCVRDCTRLLTPRFEKARIAVKIDAPDEKLTARGRAIPVKRALVNVMVNAIQASSEGGAVQIGVTGRDGQVVIEIDDSGTGIAVGERLRVFDMFHSNRPGGTGLGLWMARTAVERQSGSIGIADSPTGGARIVITLPASEEKTQ